MRRGVLLLVLGLTAALGAASARADGPGTTTTTTDGTTTTAAPSYAQLRPSYLPGGCLGAGAVAIAVPGRMVVAYGTPASDLGPSAQPVSGAVVAFQSSTGSGSTCASATVSLASVSLFGGSVTADSVAATDGKGSVTGLTVDGSPVTLSPGQTYPVGGWGQVTLETTVGRLTAPLVLQLIQSHGSLPGGTTIAVGFAAAPQPVAKPKPALTSTTQQSSPSAQARAGRAATAKKRASAKKQGKPLPPPDYPAAPFPFKLAGGLSPAAQQNDVVTTAMQYLGIPYKWAGASPKTGFDCSGLVQYVFAQLGVSLPHYTVSQWDSPDTVPVAANKLRPGDLVFFIGDGGTRKAPGHVGIYVGDGYLVDAPHTGSFVRIDSLSEPGLADQYVGARQVVGAGLPPSADAARADESGGLRQLIAARTLLGGIEVGASPAAVGPLGAPLGVAVAGRVAAGAASDGYAPWAGAAVGGLLLTLVAGGLVARRRRPSA